MFSCNNNCRGRGFFEGYQAFWIIVVIAIVIIWVHYGVGSRNCCCNDFGYNNNCCNDNCGCC